MCQILCLIWLLALNVRQFLPQIPDHMEGVIDKLTTLTLNNSRRLNLNMNFLILPYLTLNLPRQELN